MAQTKVKLISDGVIVQGNLHSSHGITTAHIGEGSNLYYTDARVGSYLSTNSFATESYVGTQITNLVDSSPATLNTLNELAAALGDDPNFAATTATSIGTKLPLAGGTLTGALLIQQSSTSTGFTTEKTGGTGSFINLKDTAGSVFIGGINSEFVIQTPSGNYSNKLTISNSGNISSLGSQFVFGAANSVSSFIRLGGDNAAGGRLYIQYEGDSSYIDSYGGHGGAERYRDLAINARNLTFKTGAGNSVTEKLYIDSSGYINTPADKRVSVGAWDNSGLTGGAAFGFSVQSTSPGLFLKETDQTNRKGFIAIHGGGMYVGGFVDFFAIDVANGNRVLTINDSLNVGIGTTTPTLSKLEVKASDTASTTDYAKKVIIATAPLIGGYTGTKIVSLLAGYDGTIHAVDLGYGYDGTGYNLMLSTNDNTTGSPIERMRIDSSGNVNVTNGGLFLNKSDGAYVSIKHNNSLKGYLGIANQVITGGSTGDIGLTATTNLIFGSGGTTERMLINSAGNVQILGIGNKNKGNLQLGPKTTGSKWSVLTGSHYNATSGSGNGSGSAGVMMIGVHAENGENHIVIGGAIYEANAATDIQFWTHTTDTSTAGGSERMRITSAGDVLIHGTYNPHSQANRGNITLSGSNSNIIAFTNNSSSKAYIYHNGLDFEINNGVAGILKFATNSTERMRITGGGNVGIGSTSPSSLLTLNKATGEVGILLEGNGTDVAKFKLSSAGVNHAVQIGSVSNNEVQFHTANSEKMRLAANGNVGIGTTSPKAKIEVVEVSGTSAFNQSNNGVKIGRIQYGWYTGVSYGNGTAFVHIKTSLWMGGAPTNNTQHIMGGFVINSYGYGALNGQGSVKFHNWSGGFPGLIVSNTGNWGTFVQNPYTSTDGYCVIVLRHNHYSTPNIDFHQSYTGYPWREVSVTAQAQSSSATGVY